MGIAAGNHEFPVFARAVVSKDDFALIGHVPEVIQRPPEKRRPVESRDHYREKAGVVDAIRSVIARTSPLTIAGTLIALAGRTDATPSLFRIAVPALLMVGRHDAVTPPSASQAMKDKIPGAELHVIPDAGHLSNLENPEEFTTHLFNFLHKLKRSSS